MRREYPAAPLVGVAAVVIEEGKILLVKRGGEPDKGLWGLPGGLVELGETLAEALRREVAEETALDVEPGEVVGMIEPIVRDEQHHIRFHYVVVDFVAYVRGGTLKAGDDAAEVRWVSPDALDGVPMRSKTTEIIQKAWAIHSRH